ncbi:hypothetical protein D9613_008459 [Agrocybe pediades]|uniref:Uncharacterized protein n=1 Tax=Agrocybe pediades TaxID=84607 RepID=A0A8H4QS38_9AGAR|nr:hypothetical protein D9613_008459 [Agrocybe pediades]
MDNQPRRFLEDSIAEFIRLGWQPQTILYDVLDVPPEGFPPVKRRPNPASQYNRNLWPPMTCAKKKKIRKGQIAKTFGLNLHDDIVDQCYVTRIMGFRPQRIAHEYLVRPLYYRAWEKYGGPEGLAYALNRKKERAKARKDRKKAAGGANLNAAGPAAAAAVNHAPAPQAAANQLPEAVDVPSDDDGSDSDSEVEVVESRRTPAAPAYPLLPSSSPTFNRTAHSRIAVQPASPKSSSSNKGYAAIAVPPTTPVRDLTRRGRVDAALRNSGLLPTPPATAKASSSKTFLSPPVTPKPRKAASNAGTLPPTPSTPGQTFLSPAKRLFQDTPKSSATPLTSAKARTANEVIEIESSDDEDPFQSQKTPRAQLKKTKKTNYVQLGDVIDISD